MASFQLREGDIFGDLVHRRAGEVQIAQRLAQLIYLTKDLNHLAVTSQLVGEHQPGVSNLTRDLDQAFCAARAS